MSNRTVPALIALAGVLIAVALFLVLRDDGGGGDDATTVAATTTGAAPTENEEPKKQKRRKPQKPELPVVEIRNGEPVGGVQELEFESGERARFEVAADAADELHFHGYDLTIDVGPKKPTEVSFEAEIEGLFELESHSTGELLAEISVVP